MSTNFSKDHTAVMGIRCFLPAAVIIEHQVYYITCFRVYTPSASVNQLSRTPSTRFSTREDSRIASAGSVGPEPPLPVTALLILRVTVGGD
jgi:hypothetical protein